MIETRRAKTCPSKLRPSTTRCSRTRSRPAPCRLALAWALACGTPVGAQAPRAQSSLASDRVLDRDGAIDVTFDRGITGSGERVAVFVGDTDVTALFERTPEGLRARARDLLLTAGEAELTIWLVDDSGSAWHDAGRFPFVVPGRFGFQPGRIDPSLSVGLKRELRRGGSDDSRGPPPEPTVDVQFSWSSEHESRTVRVETRASFVGVADRDRALRASQLGEEAPRLDLSSYALQAVGGPVSLALGHVSVGAQRHLVNGFASRGAALRLEPTPQVDLSVGVTGGSNTVGYSDLLGWDSPDHRIITASLGLDAFAEPGRLRLELTGLSGSVLPVPGFNQGVVDDPERSRGAAGRLTAALLDRRVRLDAGVSRSAFENPPDARLAQGADLVPVQEETRSARYVEASLDAIRSLRLWGTRTARLSVGYRHERIEPQYRSLGAYTTADQLLDRVSAQVDLAGIALQGGLSRGRNNLDDIASILTTDTDRSEATVRVPLSGFFGLDAPWLPTLSHQWSRTHQAGRGLPVHGGFAASHVPDQMSEDRAASADWSWGRVGLGLRWSEAHQDNRQEGREDADFVNTSRTGTLRLSLGARVSLNGDVGRDRAESVERGASDETLRYGMQATLRLFSRTSLSVRYSDTTTEDDRRVRSRGNEGLETQLSSVLPGLGRVGGEGFVRYARQRNALLDVLAELSTDQDFWTVDAGVSLRFF